MILRVRPRAEQQYGPLRAVILVSRPSLADIFRKVDTMSRIGSKKAGRRARRQFSEKFMVGAARLVLDEAEPEPDFPARQT